MRFRYPLQKIVDLKGSEKSMAEWEYAASLGRLREEKERLRELMAERENLETQLSDTAAHRITLAELAALQQYLDVLDSKIQRQYHGVAAAETLVSERQGKLAEKSVEEKVWLNARDKAFEKYKYEWMLKQQNELDEMAGIRAAASHG